MSSRTGSRKLAGTLWGILVLLGSSPIHGCTDASEQEILGSGNLVRETREVAAFTSVAFLTSGDLEIEVANREALLVEAEDNLLSRIETEVVDGELAIRHRGNKAPTPTKPLRFHLQARELDGITFACGGSVSVPHLETGRLEIRHSGSGRVDVGELQADVLTVHNSGSGAVSCERVKARLCRLFANGSGDTEIAHLEGLANDVRLTGAGRIVVSEGSVVEQEIFVSGSGEFEARGLQSALVEVMVSGCGNATVHAHELLEATISGSGDINYCGRPQLHRTITGSGRLRRI